MRGPHHCAVAYGSGKKHRREERAIVDAVRRTKGREGFKSISIHMIVDESERGQFNWAPSVADCGEADPVLCDDALRTIIPQLQRQYDMQEW